jgi:hypothetical protein
MDNINNTKLELNVIDYFCTFEYLLSYAGIDFPNETSMCFCPFHENVNTKAAKLFVENHNEHIYCFAEAKQYKPHHLLTTGIVPFSVSHVFSAIWNNLSDNERSIFNNFTYDVKLSIDFSQYYNNYKKCKLDYFDLLNAIMNS